jgi:hypothetical protein
MFEVTEDGEACKSPYTPEQDWIFKKFLLSSITVVFDILIAILVSSITLRQDLRLSHLHYLEQMLEMQQYLYYLRRRI